MDSDDIGVRKYETDRESQDEYLQINSSKLRGLIDNSNDDNRQVANQNMRDLKEKITDEELLDTLLHQDETVAKIPSMRCDVVAFRDIEDEPRSVRYSVSLRLTDKRLIFTDVEKSGSHHLERIADSNFVVRSKYRSKYTIYDDIWYYPIPLTHVNGVSFSVQHHSEASNVIEQRFSYQALIVALLGLVLIPFGLWPAGVAIMALSVPLLFLLSSFGRTRPIPHSTTSRTLTIGALDPLTQRHIVIEIAVSVNYSLHAIKEYVSMLQQFAPSLRG